MKLELVGIDKNFDDKVVIHDLNASFEKRKDLYYSRKMVQVKQLYLTALVRKCPWIKVL